MGGAYRELAPGALLFGDRFKLRDHPSVVLEEAAPFTDVLAIQNGDHHRPSPLALTAPDETWFDAAAFDQLHEQTGKPIVICDHQTSFFTPEVPQTGFGFQYRTAEEAAASYDRLLEEAFERPYFIGYFRCQLIDTCIERARHVKQGLLTAKGRPRTAFAEQLAATNRRVLAGAYRSL